MKHFLKAILTLTVSGLLCAPAVQAETEEKMVIALKTDHFEITETDVSDLMAGESRTIETENGKVIDILRTADGVEVYVDGELLEMDFDHEGVHEGHVVRKHVEIICDDGEECDEDVFVLAGDDTDMAHWVTEGGENVIIHKDIELSCTDEEGDSKCSDKMIWISEEEDIDLEKIHEMHGNGEAHKVIVIKKEMITED